MDRVRQMRFGIWTSKCLAREMRRWLGPNASNPATGHGAWSHPNLPAQVSAHWYVARRGNGSVANLRACQMPIIRTLDRHQAIGIIGPNPRPGACKQTLQLVRVDTLRLRLESRPYNIVIKLAETSIDTRTRNLSFVVLSSSLPTRRLLACCVITRKTHACRDAAQRSRDARLQAGFAFPKVPCDDASLAGGGCRARPVASILSRALFGRLPPQIAVD